LEPERVEGRKGASKESFWIFVLPPFGLERNKEGKIVLDGSHNQNWFSPI